MGLSFYCQIYCWARQWKIILDHLVLLLVVVKPTLEEHSCQVLCRSGLKLRSLGFFLLFYYDSRAIAVKTARCRCKLRCVSTFTAASRGSPCNSTAFLLIYVWCHLHFVSYRHIIDLSSYHRPQTAVGVDKPKLKVKMQSVLDDDVRKRLLEKPRFGLAARGVFRLGRCYILWQGDPGLWASNWESTATDGWSLDRWHQKTIGACRRKWPSAG